ncbi:UDP-glucosyltransferase 2-like isoform 2-T2 [Cochliomyia hominivorax]
MYIKYLIIVLCVRSLTLEAAHILSLFGVPLPSQYAFIEPLLKQLAARGHQITSISNYPQKQPIENFRDVVVEKNKNLFRDVQNFTLDNIEANYYEVVDEIYNRAIQMCKNIQNDAAVRHILDNEKIDLIIMEVFFSESFFGLSEYLNAPMVGVSTIEWAHYYYKYFPVQKQIYQYYYPNAQLTFEEAQKNFSLVLLNDHFTLSTPRPYVPNMIEVAGLNIVTKPDPLPEELKQLLDNARQGVILISLDIYMDCKTVNVFLQQFKRMPQIILWKTSRKFLNFEIPSNVYISNNFTESSILPHPHLQLYVTSGSFLTIVESVYHGLPILGIASTEKQDDYIDYIKKIGNGVSIKLPSISEKILAKAFNEILSSSHYINIAKTLSQRFRDQQNTPMERAIYWIEYVLRHKGAAHLRNMGQSLTWWQFYNIDVILFIICLCILLITLALIILKIIIEFLCNVKVRKNIEVKKKI